MRLLVHDYSGHPFQVQLSRELAGRGHDVLHIYSGDFQTPKGDLVKKGGDPDRFDVRAVGLGVPFEKSTFARRRKQEIAYGRLMAEEIRRRKPECVISSNSPLDAQREIYRACRETGSKFVFWLQDVYSEAIYRILSKKMGLFGRAVGKYYKNVEFTLLRNSDKIISITEDFNPLLLANDIDARKIDVIENWAPLSQIPSLPKDNAWARAQGLADSFNIIYSGTLGYKHNPDLLLDLAEAIDARVRVFSEGRVAEELREKARARGVDRLEVRPWVPFAELPSLLASADIVCALIEADAGVFSVPSKVLTYMAVGRPILASIPADNLAARLLLREKAGLICAPGDSRQWVAAARQLFSDAELRQRMGRNARAYADRQFDIVKIGDRFEAILDAVSGRALGGGERGDRRVAATLRSSA